MQSIQGFYNSDFTDKREFINKLNGVDQQSGCVLTTNGEKSYWAQGSGGLQGLQGYRGYQGIQGADGGSSSGGCGVDVFTFDDKYKFTDFALNECGISSINTVNISDVFEKFLEKNSTSNDVCINYYLGNPVPCDELGETVPISHTSGDYDGIHAVPLILSFAIYLSKKQFTSGRLVFEMCGSELLGITQTVDDNKLIWERFDAFLIIVNNLENVYKNFPYELEITPNGSGAIGSTTHIFPAFNAPTVSGWKPVPYMVGIETTDNVSGRTILPGDWHSVMTHSLMEDYVNRWFKDDVAYPNRLYAQYIITVSNVPFKIGKLSNFSFDYYMKKYVNNATVDETGAAEFNLTNGVGFNVNVEVHTYYKPYFGADTGQGVDGTLFPTSIIKYFE